MRLIDVEPIIEDLEREVELCNGALDNMDVVSNTREDLFVERNTILDLIQELKDEPTIDAVPAWIPVTERLPEPYSGEYLVTINDGSVYTDILWFDSPGDGRYESCFYKTDDDGYGVVCDDVIAWMPLPQPYKGERKDDETDS